MECLSYSHFRDQCLHKMFRGNRQTRIFIKANFLIFIKLSKLDLKYQVDFDTTATQNFGLSIKIQKKIKKIIKKERYIFKLFHREYISTELTRFEVFENLSNLNSPFFLLSYSGYMEQDYVYAMYFNDQFPKPLQVKEDQQKYFRKRDVSEMNCPNSSIFTIKKKYLQIEQEEHGFELSYCQDLELQVETSKNSIIVGHTIPKSWWLIDAYLLIPY
ncbi:hypothetical protein FGO68_gene652 [Halteria grandinella]|uniref:Uncharacterized protein n=1 Tax=Halteria grandinella TaxID=5974 RepID=A0A8J8T0X4_HALGN|nr:hypothetical protein FGO68_gene652 [Halteria grandinella]